MRTIAFLFGLILIALSIAGYLSPEGLLFGVFRVNFWLNLFHGLTGIFACLIAFLKIEWVRLYFQLFGVAYAILAILGFVYGERDIFGIFASNLSNTWLHVIIATNGLILGYGSDNLERERR